MSPLPWLIIRDFNEIRRNSEKDGGASRPKQQMARFNNVINSCGLIEVDFIGPKFTWIYQRSDGYQIRERLDRALVNSDWATKFPLAKLLHKSSSTSNHSPLILQMVAKKKRAKSKRSFRFESMWLKDSKYGEIVPEAWNKGLVDVSSHPLVSCLNSCRTRLQAWNRDEFGHVGKEIAQLQKLLKYLEMQPTSLDVIENMRKTRVELKCWLEKEAAMWKQRSQVDWFREGDRITSFFHAKASSRFQKNLIEGILDSNDVWQEEEAKIEKVFMEYYSELFSSANPTNFDEILEAVQPKVSRHMNEQLIKEFQPSEVFQASKQIYPLKAPGPDGMPPLFYQHFWPTVGNVVTKTVLDFLNFGVIPHNFNETQIVFDDASIISGLNCLRSYQRLLVNPEKEQ